MSTTPISPADVVRAIVGGVGRIVAGRLTPSELERELDRLAGFYAGQTDVRHPFAPLGDEPMLTRAQLREHFAKAPAETGGAEHFEPVDITVHTTQDPEVVVTEFAYAATVEGREFTIPCIFVVRVRDGQIVESRDYGDHVGMARAFGRLEDLAGALASRAAAG